MACERSITFTLAGSAGSPGVLITATEADNGRIDFQVQVLSTATVTADLRGLFFDLADDAKLAGLSFSGSGTPRISDFDTVDVLSLKGGANMNGAASPFDVGLEFGSPGIGKDDYQSAAFTLSNAAGNLTLDDIAHVDFGVRLASIGAPGSNKRQEKDGAKLVAVSPAAPDAHDDAYTIFEDGAAGLNDPQSVSKGVVMPVLANDTDADAADRLTVTHVDGATHGTLTIVDGPDADNLPGDAVMYTPQADWSGSDSFSYCVSDGHGGTDSAEVSVQVTAVADKPEVTVSVVDAADAVNQVRLMVVAKPTDDDGSEALTSLVPGSVPAGLSLSPLGPVVAGPQGQLSQPFMLTLPLGQSVDVDQAFSATAQEASNADTQAASAQVDVVSLFKDNQRTVSLEVDDASLWGNGQGPGANVLGPMLGISAGPDLDLYPYPLRYQIQATIHSGFQPFLTIEGGSLDAALDYDVTIETTHNRSTDTLLISPSAALTGGTFASHGPGGRMGLDFVFGYDIGLKLGLDFDADLGETLEATFLEMHQGDQWSLANILEIEDDDPGFTIDAGLLNGTSGTVQWPQVNVQGGSFDAATGTVKGSGAASFISVQADLDSLLLGSVLGNVSPFDIPVVADFDVDPLADVSGFLRLLDLDVGADLKLQQELSLKAQAMNAVVTFENGHSMPLVFGQDLLIQNALATYDATSAGGNGNGRVEYTVAFDGAAELHNKTDVAVEKTVDYKVLDLDIVYDVDFVVDQWAGEFHEALVDIHESSVDLTGVADQTFGVGLQSVSWSLDAGL